MEDVNISKYRASVVRDGSKPASPGYVVSEGQNPTDPAGSGQNHLPVTITPTATGLSITENQVLGGAGTVGQYIRGDGSLADFPQASGGGSSVSYYLNGSVNQGTIGGVDYRELSKVPILGAGTDFTINADGYIASFITDAGDPNLLEIPGGNWNFETYFSASSSGGTPTFYVELYKYDGTTFTLIASSSSAPELIAFGTSLNPYFSSLAVPTTTLALTDRLAIRYYVTHSGRTITLHTENNHLCQVITTFTTGLTSLNGLTAQVQNLAVGTSGTDFNIASATATHTFNLPTASGTNRGALSSADWTTFNNKQNALTNPVTGTGTTNYLPKFTGTSSIGNSIVQDAGIRVDIGGDIRLTPSSAVNIQAYTGSVYTNLFYNAASHNWQNSGGATKMFLNSNDNLLIGTTSDNGARLQVSGNVYIARSSNPYLTIDDTGVNSEGGILFKPSGFNSKGGLTINYSTAEQRLFVGEGGNSYFQTFYTNGSERLRITSSGNVGIGTSSPNNYGNTTVTIASTGTNNVGALVLRNSDSSLRGHYYSDGANGIMVLGSATSSPLTFVTGDVERMRLTSSGNLGLGVTPSAWDTNVNVRALQMNAGSIWGFSTVAFLMVQNSFSNTSGIRTYVNNGFASEYEQTSGQHIWKTAPSGTAGNAISFTQAMTLTSGGNLLVGTTTDNGARLNLNGSQYIRGGNELRFYRIDNAIYTQLYDAGSTFALDNRNGNGFSFQSAGTPQMTITSSGNVGIGTASPSTLLHVNGSGSQIGRIVSTFALSSGFSDVVQILNPNQTGGGLSFNIGKSETTRNLGKMAYVHSSDGSTSNRLSFGFYDADNLLNLTAGGNVLIGTTTDNGARLQVSGEGRFYQPLTNTTSYLTVENNRARNAAIRLKTTVGDFLIGTGIGADVNQFQIYDNTAGANRLVISSTGAATFSSSVTTGAPAGGTAQPWKLGNVATVSPTSPNRTIEVEVNGTTYYLHAKTTNN